MACVVNNGKIKSVEILDQGYGYSVAPIVFINSDVVSRAKILTSIDLEGRVVSVTIFDAGSGFEDRTKEEIEHDIKILQTSINQEDANTQEILSKIDEEIKNINRINSTFIVNSC